MVLCGGNEALPGLGILNVGQSAWAVGALGAATVVAMLAGADTVGGILALFQLGLFVGAPLAVVLHRELRSWPIFVVVAAGLSIALSAIAVQSLIWFRVANGELVVATATAYGIVLALLISSVEPGLGGSERRDRW